MNDWLLLSAFRNVRDGGVKILLYYFKIGFTPECVDDLVFRRPVMTPGSNEAENVARTTRCPGIDGEWARRVPDNFDWPQHIHCEIRHGFARQRYFGTDDRC